MSNTFLLDKTGNDISPNIKTLNLNALLPIRGHKTQLETFPKAFD